MPSGGYHHRQHAQPEVELLTIPDEELEDKKDERPDTSVFFRLHKHDHSMLKGLLKQDKMTMQRFFELCVRGYLDAQPELMRALKDMRAQDAVPRIVREKHVLSQRERASIFDEIEAAQKGEDE